MDAPMKRAESDPTEYRDEATDRIQAALRGLRFGTVTAVVQDGVVVQIERMEKLRIEPPGRRTTARRPGPRAVI